MKEKRSLKNWKFVSGIIILVVLLISYFIKLNVDSGANFSTTQPLLAKLIFESPFVLAVYVLAGLALMLSGLSEKKKRAIH